MSQRAARRTLHELISQKCALLGRIREIGSVYDYVFDGITDCPRRTRMLDDLEALRESVQADLEHLETVLADARDAMIERIAAKRDVAERPRVENAVGRMVAMAERRYRS